MPLISAMRGLMLSTVGILAVAIAAPTSAQSAAAEDKVASPGATPAALAPSATPTAGLEEIVVTAERRSQSLQDVPISPRPFSTPPTFRGKGVRSVADLQQLAPSVAINTFNRSTFINIRGVGIAQSAPTSSPGVAFYIDGQLIPHEQFIGQAFYDIGSIEVLRGPQGTLTGQNSTGGALYVRTPEPEYDRYSGYLDVTYGNYDSLKVVGAINVPISDEAALRIAGTRDRRDSFTRNIGGPSHPGDSDLYAGRVNLAVRSANDVLHANFRVDYFKSKSDNNAVKRRNDTVSIDPFVIEEDARSYQNQDGYRLGQETRIALTPKIDVRSLLSYQKLNTYDQTDGDRTATALPRPPTANVGRVSYASTRFDTFMAEVNLLSSGKHDFNWVIGGFYLDETIKLLQLRDNNHTTDFVSSTSTTQSVAQNTTKSGFGQASYLFRNGFEILGGARYSEDQQVYQRLIVANAVPATGLGIGIQQSDKVTGKLALNYHFGRNLVYVSASQGYKAGGVNLTPGTPNFGPEQNRVYEGGFKTQFLDNRLRLNGDIYYSNYTNIQLSSLLGTLPVTQNAAAGKSYGAELELTGQFGGLGFNAGAGYLHARFDGTSCITDTNSPGTTVGCPTNLRFVPDGQYLPFSPEWTLNAGAQYEIPFGSNDMSLTPRVQWAYAAQQIATPFPSANTIVPGHNVYDARLTLQLSRRYKLEAFVLNFTDERYIASQIQSSSSADGGIIYGAPRTYGFRAVAKF